MLMVFVGEIGGGGFGFAHGELETAIVTSLNNGAKEICLFAAGRMTAADWVVFEGIVKRFRGEESVLRN